MDKLFFGQIVMAWIICKGLSALEVNMNSGIIAVIGSHVELKCHFGPVGDDMVTRINLQARNTDDYEDIAAFYPAISNRKPYLNHAGQNLTNRVNLTNPTSSDNVATMTFNKIQCRDGKAYKCVVQFDSNKAHKSTKSTPTTVTVLCCQDNPCTTTEPETTYSMPEKMTTMKGTMTTSNSTGTNGAISTIIPVASFVACLITASILTWY